MFDLILAMAPDVTVRASATAGYSAGTTVVSAGGAPTGTSGGTVGAMAGFDLAGVGVLSTDMLGVTAQSSYSDLSAQTGGTQPFTFAFNGAYRHQHTLSPRTGLLLSLVSSLARNDPGVPAAGGGAAANASIGLTTGWLGSGGLLMTHEVSPTVVLTLGASGTATRTLDAATPPNSDDITGWTAAGGGATVALSKEVSTQGRIRGTVLFSETDYLKALNPLTKRISLLPRYFEEVGTATAGYTHDFSAELSATSEAGVAVASSTPLSPLAAMPVLSQQVRYAASTAFFSGGLSYQYAAPTVLSPAGQQLALLARGSGTLGSSPPLRYVSLAGGLNLSRTTYSGGGATAWNAGADVLGRLAVTSWLGVILGTAFTFAETEGNTGSTVNGVSVYAGLSGYFSTLREADPTTSAMAVPLAR